MGFLRTYGGKVRKLAGVFSRGIMRANTKLGRIRVPLPEHASKIFRNPALCELDAYYDGTQYDHLHLWHQAEDSQGTYIQIRERKPRIIYHFPKVLSQRITSKLVGETTFPKFNVEQDPDTQEYLRFIIKASKIRAKILEPMRRMLASGSSLVRYWFAEGSIQMESFLSKYCYPEFGPTGELQKVMIKYVYEDDKELDDNGKPVVKWYRMDLGMMSDILYDNPKFEKDEEPKFVVVSQVDHELGFVQAEWFRTAEIRDSVDGYSLIQDVLDFVDELNYSLSQSSTATSYNQDPQLMINKMDEEELNTLIRSATKAWNLGREGEAKFLESGLNGVTVASELRKDMNQNIQDIARIVLLDPEKIVGNAQSAKAMEVLHGPMLELISELRHPIGDSLKNIIVKMAMTNLILIQRGEPGAVNVPEGYQPKSLDIEIAWPQVFPMTMQDLQQKASVASSVTGANLISRETGTKWLAKDFGVEDVEEEIRKVNEQPILNPFGGGFM